MTDFLVKSCPFCGCGHKAIQRKYPPDGEHMGFTLHWVVCANEECHAGFPKGEFTSEGAENKWNERYE